LVENGRLNLPHLYSAPPFGVTPLEFRLDFWHQKRVPGLSYGVICVILGLAVLVDHRRVTDGQTPDDGKYRASIASRGKNWHQKRRTSSSFSCYVALVRVTKFCDQHVCMSVRSHSLSEKPHVQTSRNCLCTTVTRSSSGGSAICFVLQVLLMTSCSHII